MHISVISYFRYLLFIFLKVREEEIPELEKLMSECWLGPIKGGVENEYGKVNILLQSYISKSQVDSFSLVSDMSYIAQVIKSYSNLLFIVN